MADSVPIVVICGQVPTHVIGTDAFQEAPVSAVMGSVAKHVFLVTDPTAWRPRCAPRSRSPRSGRPGPVVIDIPKDVQNWIGEYQGTGLLPIKSYRQRVRRCSDRVNRRARPKRFSTCCSSRRRPLIYVGGGVINSNASEALRLFAAALPDSGDHDADGYRRLRHD